MTSSRPHPTLVLALLSGALVLLTLGLWAFNAVTPVTHAEVSDPDPKPADPKPKEKEATRTPTPAASATPTANRAPTRTPTPQDEPTRGSTAAPTATKTAKTPTPSMPPPATDTPAPIPTTAPTATPEPTAAPARAATATPASGDGAGGQQPPKIVFVPQVQPPAPPAPQTPLAAPPPAAMVAPAPEAYRFVLGFAALKEALGPIMGDPVEAEHGVPDNCDTQQLTTTGLAYWRCSTGMLTFAAFPDGLQHWALTPLGVASWTGESPEPPPDATFRSISEPADTTLLAVPQAGDPPAPCLTPGDGPLTACAIAPGASTLGYMTTAGETHAYRFDVGPTGAAVFASLADLPADYDLYLVDNLAQILASSIREGFESETVALDLGGGSYYLYVHADVGRPAVPDLPYLLVLSLTEATSQSAELGEPTLGAEPR